MGAETPSVRMNVPATPTVQPGLYVRQTSGLVRTVGPRTALLANLVGMGIIVNFFWVVFASFYYPTANLTETVAIAVVFNLGVAYVYWMLASAMPRSGGDYVFVGRIFHPSLGFATNLTFSFIFVSWAGLFSNYFAHFGVPMILGGYGVTGNNSWALNMAATISGSATDQFWIGAVILGAVILISLLPTKWIFRTAVGIFLVSGLIFVIMMAILFTTPQSTFTADWNANAQNLANTCNGVVGTTNTVQCVINTFYTSAMTSAGGIAFAGSGLLIGIVYTMLSFIGYANTAYFGSEIRGAPTRTQGLAIFGSPLLFAALIALLYAGTYYTFGHNFLVAASANWNYGYGAGFPAIPSPLFLVSYILHNALLSAFLAFGIALTFFGFVLIYFIIPTRNLFAWSFDRILPTFVARVSRGGVPYVTVLILGFFAFVCLWLTTYTTLFAFLTYANFGFWLAVGIVCLAGAFFPFLRPQLYRASPRIVQTSLGKLPLITLVGVLSAGASFWVVYASAIPAFTLQAIQWSQLALFPIVFIIGLVIYGVSHVIQRSRGLPIDLINKQLPPE
ncbi:MAG: amino acid permease [Thermoplasmata archaeon]|nr:amino acid permease [Thermoplasmata archaeon]